MKRLSLELVRKLRDARRQGVTVKELAQEYNITPRTIWNYCNDLLPASQRRPDNKRRNNG